MLDINAKLEELQKELLKRANAKEEYNDLADEIDHLREVKQATVNIEKDGVPFAGEMVFTNKLPAPPTGDHSFRLLMTLAVIVPLLFAGAYLLRRKRGS